MLPAPREDSSDSGKSPVDDLVERLTLEALDRDLYLGDPGPGEGRLFGGLVAAQSARAACLTIETDPPSHLHSLHAYFLRPGRYGVPIRFTVHRIRDGRTFTTRSVVAYQGGEAIFNLSASFTKPEEGIAHQAPMPAAPGPDGLEEWSVLRAKAVGEPPPERLTSPVEVRVPAQEFEPGHPPGDTRYVWMRLRGELPDDPDLHTAALVYASDRTLLSTAMRPIGRPPGTMMGASLDHAMYIHHPPKFDDWLLYASNSPIAEAARGLIVGRMYSPDGVQVATVVQEGLIRIREPRG